MTTPLPPDPVERPSPQDSERPSRFTDAQKRLVAFICVLAVTAFVYRLVYAKGLSDTAALYVGVPAVLAIGLALLPASKSATGAILKGSTLAMMVACVALPEGLVCLLFALPLVFLVALFVGGSADLLRRREEKKRNTLMMIGLPLLILSSEGVVGSPFDSHDAVRASRVVNASPASVMAALAATPRFTAPMPRLLKLGFNRPVHATGTGLGVGDSRTIEFTGGTHDDHPLRLFGLTGRRSVDHHADMTLRVASSSPVQAVFDVTSDDTMLARWVDLDRAIVTVEPAGANRTRVTWRLEYKRLLTPTFYFGPLQRAGMSDAAGYLVDALVVDALEEHRVNAAAPAQ